MVASSRAMGVVAGTRAAKVKNRAGQTAKWALITLFLAWTVIPVLIVVTNAFKWPLDIFTKTPKLIFEPTLENFVTAFGKSDFLRYFMNSTIVALTSTVFVLVLSVFAAWGLTSLRLRRANWISNAFLVGKLVPVISMLLPLFAIMRMAGLRGSLLAPAIAHVALQLPFMVWMLMGFMRDVPRELEQAALIDGCTRLQTLFRIVIPVILPGIAAAFILAMQYSWNELLFSLQLTTFETYTLPVGIASFVGAVSVNAGVACAAATVTMAPMVVLGFFIQKYLAAGTTGGAVKG
ncbi:MAG: carbohydrate ABC transporter permease [Bifidobacteriaceae bacterium]|jgi:multiple sugar transport system permease protein|nr:carbohydrate ABC transporter permease [Bifidobacteriaceae bacterium]